MTDIPKTGKSKRIPRDRTRVLIVDDEKSIRDVFKMVLSYGLSDCRIDLAINGAEALDSFNAAHHGVILMDLHMPVMDGETAFHKITEMCEKQNWEMPSVVFCTGFDPSEDLRRIVANSRAHAIIRKPVDNKTLLESLKNALQKRFTDEQSA